MRIVPYQKAGYASSTPTTITNSTSTLRKNRRGQYGSTLTMTKTICAHYPARKGSASSKKAWVADIQHRKKM